MMKNSTLWRCCSILGFLGACAWALAQTPVPAQTPAGEAAPAEAKALESVSLSAVLNPRQADNELARPILDKGPGRQAPPLKVAGQTYERGVCMQAESFSALDVKGAVRFVAQVGVDDATENQEPVVFSVEADGQTLWRSPELHKGDALARVDVDLRGRKRVILGVEDVGTGQSRAYADWVYADFILGALGAEQPASVPIAVRVEEAVSLTPAPALTPRINSARVFGVRPSAPVLFTVAVTGERPLRFSAKGLPKGLTLDPMTGRIGGVLAQAGTYAVTLRVTNSRGSDEKKLRIVVGEEIALTPPMGWNSWNCWGKAVDQDKVMRSAKAMAASGLIDHGWTYVNIDDAWQAQRGGKFQALQGNEKFPDLQKLCADIHGLGLKVGIYSTPWVTSYAGFPGGSSDDPEGKWSPDLPRRVLGKVSFAVNDARQWAEWGIDYLKYDWNPNRRPETEEMAKALRACGRDIVYSLSNSMPFDNVAELSKIANAWRTTGDINDSWGSLSRIGFSQERWRPYSKPGHWNDPDMLVVGRVGWGPNLHPSRLTPNEQYTHISLWALVSSPLLIGCDLEQLDAFTLNLLTNDEVLEVSQDPLGRQAAQVQGAGRLQVWVKEMEDGSRAIGLFNLSRREQTVTAEWSQLGLTGPRRVRDLWRQRDLGVFSDKFSAAVPRHGVVLVRVWPAKK